MCLEGNISTRRSYNCIVCVKMFVGLLAQSSRYSHISTLWATESNSIRCIRSSLSYLIYSIQEQPRLRVFDNPRKPFLQILPRHGAASQDVPPVRADGLELETLQYLRLAHAPLNVGLVGEDEETSARESLHRAGHEGLSVSNASNEPKKGV